MKNINYVAILDHTEQVGFEQSQTFREAVPLDGTETVKELILWGETFIEKPQIVVVLATKDMGYKKQNKDKI